MNPFKFVYKALRILLSPRYRFRVLDERGFYASVSDEQYVKMQYYSTLGSKLNLKNPQTFNEKIQWLKLYDHQPRYTDLVDKYEAKRIVGSIIGDEYIIPALGVWDKFEDIDFDLLPERFILKCTHNSGGAMICTDKKHFDFEYAEKRFTKLLRRNYYMHSREWPYKNVKPRIIAEKYLENIRGKGLHDYKVFCFNGKPEYIYYVEGRQEETVYAAFYDLDWNRKDFVCHNPLLTKPVEKPARLDDLISCAEKLAEGIPFVRVDFYILKDGSIKFGEMTFFPNAGKANFEPDEVNYEFGRLIDLSRVHISSGG